MGRDGQGIHSQEQKRERLDLIEGLAGPTGISFNRRQFDYVHINYYAYALQ